MPLNTTCYTKVEIMLWLAPESLYVAWHIWEAFHIIFDHFNLDTLVFFLSTTKIKKVLI